MFFVPVATAAYEVPNYSPEFFLEQINSASSYEQIKGEIENHSVDIGVNLSEYNNLTAKDKAGVIQKIVGNRYYSISDFVQHFESAVADSKSKSGGSSTGGGGRGGVLIPAPNKQYDFNISGVISLPDGEIAPQGGFEVALQISGDTYDSVIIPEGSSSVEYYGVYQVRSNESNIIISFVLTGDENAKYQMLTNTEVLPLSEQGNTFIADIKIPYAQRKIGGVFRLAEDIGSLNDDLPIRVDLATHDVKISIDKTLAAGQRDAEFLVGVSPGEYSIAYTPDTQGKSALQHISVASETIFVDVLDNDKKDIVGIIISQNYIEGYIRLPDGETAPEGGLLVEVGSAIAEIPHGYSQAYYRTGMYYQTYLHCSVLSKDYSGTQFSGGYYTADNTLSIKQNNVVDFYGFDESLNIDLTLKKMQWIEGVVSLDEPLSCDVGISILIQGELFSYGGFFHIEAGATSAPYFIEIEEPANSLCHINWRLRPENLKYVNVFGSDEFIAEEYLSQLNICAQVDRAAELFNGNVSLPESMGTSDEIYMQLNFESKNHSFSQDIVINAGESSAEYAIYGESPDIADFSGEYTISAQLSFLTGETLYYNGAGFSFEPPFAIAVENETIVRNIVLPEPNREIIGRVIMPIPATSEMGLYISVFSDCAIAVTEHIPLSVGAQSFDYEIKLLIPDEYRDYKISYMVADSDNKAYYNYLDLYLSEDGYTLLEQEGEIFDLYGRLQPLGQDIDLGGLMVIGCIEGDFILPNSYVVPTGEYFSYVIHATNGKHTQSKNYIISGRENKAHYMMSFPRAYQGDEWTIWYSVGNVVPEPSTPVIPKPPGIAINMPGGGGSGSSYPKHVIPDNLHQGYNIYLAQSGGLSFYESDARKFAFTQSEFENINIYALGTDTPAPRIIGGFFTSATDIPENGVSVSVILKRTDMYENLTQNFFYTGEAVKYKFITYGDGDYILKYIIDGEEFYYQDNYKLTSDRNLATTIETAGIPAQYGKDVYYKNIYPQSYYAKVLHFLGANLPEYLYKIKILIYNNEGNVINEGFVNKAISLTETPVVIGYKIGGYKAYFTECFIDNSYHYLRGHTTDFSMAAKVYPVPQRGAQFAYMQIGNPTVGFSRGVGTDAAIDTSYFDYNDIDENTVCVNKFYMVTSNVGEAENDVIFLACYELSGRLKFVKSFPLFYGETVVDLNWSIDKSDIIRVIGLGDAINPLFEELSFFGL